MTERLWATWRMSYIKGEPPRGCIFCEFPGQDRDQENLILGYSRHSYVIMNRYPYTNGHLMVIPYQHGDSPWSLPPGTQDDLHRTLLRAEAVLQDAYGCHGMNIGMNIGAAAGAGIDAHVHYHIVPRWRGDTNFIPVFADTRLINQSLEDTWAHLESFFRKAGFAARRADVKD
ncbi:MAG: AP-4-A phosphorylase [Myxococcota bacterium]|nr:AP-4-A phosphorylase [Myxococcota bacterium]